MGLFGGRGGDVGDIAVFPDLAGEDDVLAVQLVEIGPGGQLRPIDVAVAILVAAVWWRSRAG